MIYTYFHGYVYACEYAFLSQNPKFLMAVNINNCNKANRILDTKVL